MKKDMILKQVDKMSEITKMIDDATTHLNSLRNKIDDLYDEIDERDFNYYYEKTLNEYNELVENLKNILK